MMTEFFIYFLLLGSLTSLGICLTEVVQRAHRAVLLRDVRTAGGSFLLTEALAEQMLSLSLAVALLLWMLAGLWLSNFFLGGVVGLGGFFLPKIALEAHRAKRRQLFQRQLVDALESMRSSLQAGLELPQAFHLIPEQMGEPIREEFTILIQQLDLGRSIPETLEALSVRMPIEDVKIMSQAIRTSIEVGGDLPRLLAQLAETIRARFEIDNKLRTLTAQSRFQGVILAFMPLLLVLVLHRVDPTFLEPLYTTPVGMVILSVVALFYVLGFFFIREILKIDV